MVTLLPTQISHLHKLKTKEVYQTTLSASEPVWKKEEEAPACKAIMALKSCSSFPEVIQAIRMETPIAQLKTLLLLHTTGIQEELTQDFREKPKTLPVQPLVLA